MRHASYGHESKPVGEGVTIDDVARALVEAAEAAGSALASAPAADALDIVNRAGAHGLRIMIIITEDHP